ncbi:V-type H+-transporting ATPase subunit d [Enteropsectra breve]|nr:V-type H+-transporting ATPase subunit d [Enteropsectra breve]
MDLSFIIADINGRFNHLLKSCDYESLARCTTLNELVVKIGHFFSGVDEDAVHSLSELKAKLVQTVSDEFGEFKSYNLLVLQYLEDYNRIIRFFSILENSRNSSTNKEQAFEERGIRPCEMSGLKECKTFHEAEKLYVRGSHVARFFKNIEMPSDPLEKCDLKALCCRVLKNYFELYHAKSSGYFREVVEAECNRFVYEISLNGSHLENKTEYFPLSATLPTNTLKGLGSAISPEDVRNVLEISNPGLKNCMDPILENQLKIYAESFNQFNSSSCIYSYFRLKEQEISNIVWIAGCILREDHLGLVEYISFDR